MKRTQQALVGLAAVWGVLMVGGLAAAAEKEAWKPLMDGKTLSGWHAVGDGAWTVEEGAIVGRAHKEKLYGLLVSNEAYQDFTVRFKFKSLTGDSGFYIRTIIKEPEKPMDFRCRSAGWLGHGGVYESYAAAGTTSRATSYKATPETDDWIE